MDLHEQSAATKPFASEDERLPVSIKPAFNNVELLPPVDQQAYCYGRGCALNRMEYLDVAKKVKRDGTSYYVIDVYLHRSEHLQRASASAYSPTAASPISVSDMRELMLAEREPDYQVEHRFTAFQELKNALQRVSKQHADYCTHCQTLHAYLEHSDNQAWTLKRILKTGAARQKLLSNFINGVLSLTSETESNNRFCRVNGDVTDLVERFLRRRYEETLGII